MNRLMKILNIKFSENEKCNHIVITYQDNGQYSITTNKDKLDKLIDYTSIENVIRNKIEENNVSKD